MKKKKTIGELFGIVLVIGLFIGVLYFGWWRDDKIEKTAYSTNNLEKWAKATEEFLGINGNGFWGNIINDTAMVLCIVVIVGSYFGIKRGIRVFRKKEDTDAQTEIIQDIDKN